MAAWKWTTAASMKQSRQPDLTEVRRSGAPEVPPPPHSVIPDWHRLEEAAQDPGRGVELAAVLALGAGEGVRRYSTGVDWHSASDPLTFSHHEKQHHHQGTLPVLRHGTGSGVKLHRCFLHLPIEREALKLLKK